MKRMPRNVSWIGLILAVFILIGVISMLAFLAIPLILIALIAYIVYRNPRISWWLKSKMQSRAKSTYTQSKSTKHRKSHLRVITMDKEDSNDDIPKYH
ncbi:hypothetical protein NV379_07140 [Paenibacillus sp. N1-5-1-14]|uniref:hypothetical protein n=1 Tax=Paenibacillus radicibacter TaxID=2972488 RepID=UPI0021591078|nr:hypothetical protein [Paenibacillus radicibacter]MCR8642435.1 hypothetical protein [Paenibacillus radicibacter]